MTDIVERLRGPRTEQGGLWPHPNLHDESADTIEALRAENARLREAHRVGIRFVGASDAAIEELQEENAKLRAALKNWDALIRHQYTGSRAAMSDMTECAQETAKLLFGDDPWPKIEARAKMGESDE